LSLEVGAPRAGPSAARRSWHDACSAAGQPRLALVLRGWRAKRVERDAGNDLELERVARGAELGAQAGRVVGVVLTDVHRDVDSTNDPAKGAYGSRVDACDLPRSWRSSEEGARAAPGDS